MSTAVANSSGSQHEQAPPYSLPSIVGQTCFLILIILAAVIGNSLVVLVVWSSKKLRKSTYYFIVSLAVSDILIAVTIVPFRVHHMVNLMIWDLGPNVCQMWFFMDLFCSSASTTNVALIAVDRYVALSYPFRYPQMVSGKRCAVAIAFVWTFSIVLSSLSFTKWSDDAFIADTPACYKNDKTYYVFATFLGLFTPLVILIVAYSLVFRVALRQAIRIKAHSNVNISRPVNPAKNGHRPKKTEKTAKRSVQTRLLLRELKATKTLMIVVGSFLICWFPLCVVLVVAQHCPTCLARRLSQTWQQIIGITFVYTLPKLNSALNPIIYSIFNREFRTVLCLLCGRVTSVLPRTNGFACAASLPGHRNRFCGGSRANNESNSDYSTTYEPSPKSRSPSMFTYKNLESCFYETSV